MKTLKQIRKTERKNHLIISADVIYSETFEDVSIIHTRINMTTEWDPQTGEEGAKKQIMSKFEKWMKGE
jgi:hypothetical protein